jgi:hypothetical protein
MEKLSDRETQSWWSQIKEDIACYFILINTSIWNVDNFLLCDCSIISPDYGIVSLAMF